MATSKRSAVQVLELASRRKVCSAGGRLDEQWRPIGEKTGWPNRPKFHPSIFHSETPGPHRFQFPFIFCFGSAAQVLEFTSSRNVCSAGGRLDEQWRPIGETAGWPRRSNFRPS